MLVALPTVGHEGLEDVICKKFARAPYFTILEIGEEGFKVVKIVKNEYAHLSYGVGPIIVKMLKDLGVNVIGLPEAGVGVKQLIRELGMSYFETEAGLTVREVLERLGEK